MDPDLKELMSGANHQHQVESDASEYTKIPNAKGSRKERLEGKRQINVSKLLSILTGNI